MSSAKVLRVDAVVRDLDYFGPLQTGRVLDRFAQLRRRVAVGDDVQPVTLRIALPVDRHAGAKPLLLEGQAEPAGAEVLERTECVGAGLRGRGTAEGGRFHRPPGLVPDVPTAPGQIGRTPQRSS